MRHIATLPMAGQMNGNYDDTYLSVGLRGKPPTIVVIDVEGGDVREVGRFEPPFMFRGHVKWSRTASNLLSFSAGPDWHKEGDPQHLRVMDPADGIVRTVYEQAVGELLTHDSWWVDDQIVYCGAPQAVGLPGDPEKREMSHVNLLDHKTGVVRIVAAGSWWPGSDKDVWRRNWWHAAGSDDGRWIVADTFSGDVVLFEGATTRPRLLTSGHRTSGVQHAEPGWDRSGERVIFSSHMLGSMDGNDDPTPRACIADVPADWQEMNSTGAAP